MRTDNVPEKKPSNSNNIKIKTRSRSYEWDYFRAIPIREVIDLLGFEVNSQNRFLCPCHNDHTPSAHINDKNGDNRWWCYTCNTGGSTVDLVMKARNCDLQEAGRFLAQYYPEGEKNRSDQEEFVGRPYMNVEFYNSIGLAKNPYSNTGQTVMYVDEMVASKLTPQERRKMYGQLYRKEQMDVEEWVITSMVIEKIMETQTNIMEEANAKRNKAAWDAIDKAMDANEDLPYEEAKAIYQEAYDHNPDWEQALARFRLLGLTKDKFMDYYEKLRPTVLPEHMKEYEMETDDPEEEPEAEI